MRANEICTRIEMRSDGSNMMMMVMMMPKVWERRRYSQWFNIYCLGFVSGYNNCFDCVSYGRCALYSYIPWNWNLGYKFSCKHRKRIQAPAQVWYKFIYKFGIRRRRQCPKCRFRCLIFSFVLLPFCVCMCVILSAVAHYS